MRRRLLMFLAVMLLGVISVRALSAPAKIALLGIRGDDSVIYVAKLREGLRELGYIEGRDISFDEHFLVDRYDALQSAAQSLVASKPDVIVSWGTSAPHAAM